MTERAAVKDTLDGRTRDIQFRLTNVWVKRDGSWHVIARQGTPIIVAPELAPGSTPVGPDTRHASANGLSVDQVKEAEALRERAVVARDFDTLQTLLADDYIHTVQLLGKPTAVQNKEQWIGIRKAGLRTETLQYSDTKYTAFGNDVVVFTAIYDLTRGGRESDHTIGRVTRVWVKLAGRWQLAASHTSQLPSQQVVGRQETRIAESPQPQPSETAPADEDALRTAESSFVEAVLHRDTQTLSRVLSDDCVVTAPGGSIRDKAAEIAFVHTSVLTFESWTNENMKVRIYGSTAVVNRLDKIKVHSQTEGRSGAYRYTNVWAMRDGQWQLVSHNVFGPLAIASSATANERTRQQERYAESEVGR